MRTVRLMHIVGTRPNFMKIAPVMTAIAEWNTGAHRAKHRVRFEQVLVHTGQHYDAEMSSVFFDDLGLPQPDIHLDVRSGSHAEQTASLMLALEEVMAAEGPDLVMVVGDVNSTLAGALVASKLVIPVAHVESGLRSGDRAMPEEVNRLVTDRLSRMAFTTSAAASEQLHHEGVDPSWTFFVGNTMIDCLERTLPVAVRRGKARDFCLLPRSFGLVTLHRPSNVDDLRQLSRMTDVVNAIASRVPVVFPVHVRTNARLCDSGILDTLIDNPNVTLLPPLGYIDFLSLLADARLVVTDSGGIQAETCVVGTPCVTARTTTEWSETIEAGTNTLADPRNPASILAAVDDVLQRPLPAGGIRPELWDGQSATRIAAVLAEWASRTLEDST